MTDINKPDAFTAKQYDSSIRAYALHKPARKRYPTRSYRAKRRNQFWQADLNEMIPYAKENDGNKYILTIVDVFSRYAWALPLKNKTSKAVMDAFKSLSFKPRYLHTDQGKEFENKYFREWLKLKGISQFSVKSQFKASIVERFNRTLKNRMFRYFTHKATHVWYNILQKFIDGYNNTKHRTIQMTPSEAFKPKNKLEVFKIQEMRILSKTKRKPKYKIGDYVKISKSRNIFAKGYEANWTEETFRVCEMYVKYSPTMYALKDADDEVIEGKFYTQELQKVPKPEFHAIERIIEKRGKKALVKFIGYKHNQWININQVKHYE